jgi:hypothetical protein
MRLEDGLEILRAVAGGNWFLSYRELQRAPPVRSYVKTGGEFKYYRMAIKRWVGYARWIVQQAQ